MFGFAERQFRCVVCRGFVRSNSGHGITDLSGQVGHGFGRVCRWICFCGAVLVGASVAMGTFNIT